MEVLPIQIVFLVNNNILVFQNSDFLIFKEIRFIFNHSKIQFNHISTILLSKVKIRFMKF